jgi:predicted RNase H-like nuclease (RuvC/YqgF family)
LLCGGGLTAIGAWILWSWREEKRELNERIKKLEDEFDGKDDRIEGLERDLLNLQRGGDDF